jgi:hypothetical protein
VEVGAGEVVRSTDPDAPIAIRSTSE